MSKALTAEKREAVTGDAAGRHSHRAAHLAWFRQALVSYAEEIAAFSTLKTMFMGLVTPDGKLDVSRLNPHYERESSDHR